MKNDFCYLPSLLDWGLIIYHLKGCLFFASTETLLNAFDFHDETEKIIIDFSRTRIIDESAAACLKKIIERFEENGKDVQTRGADEKSRALVYKLYG